MCLCACASACTNLQWDDKFDNSKVPGSIVWAMATGQSDPANENMQKELSSSTILCGSNRKQCWKHNADSGGWAYESMSKCEF